MATGELVAGRKAPAFRGEATMVGKVALSDFAGKHLVLYFYPKDATSGWTKEAIAFRDAKATFTRRGAAILGVSKDTLSSHEKFAEKQGLDFPLLADPDREVIGKYGVFKEKKMYGKTVMGVERSTFLIDGAGKIRRVWRKVKVDGHADEVLAALDEVRAEDKAL